MQGGAANGAATPGKQLPADYLIDTLLAVDPATAGAAPALATLNPNPNPEPLMAKGYDKNTR